MREKYDSTDFWYTFINSLYNEGLSAGKGELEMDEETQEKLLDYLKEKIEEGVTNGETALPPGLHNYFWRFTEEILPKIQTLVEGFLKTDSDNSAASLILTLVERADWESQRPSLLDINIESIPNDPCMNLAIIDEYRSSHGYFGDFDKQGIILKVLENLYTWAAQQEDTARYQEARSFYRGHKITSYTVYKHLKDKLMDFKEGLENPERLEWCRNQIEKCNALIKKCRDLSPEEQAAFQNNSVQESDEQQKLLDTPSKNTDFWEAYLDTLEDLGLSGRRWKLTPRVQEQLLNYFKTKIEEGVVDGQTRLPLQLPEYVPIFPEAMLLELREFAEEVLENQPENGAAAKMLAIIVEKSESPFLEQAIELLPNDPEICFYAISRYSKPFSDCSDSLLEQVLLILEKLFARAPQQDGAEIYRWLTELYKEIGITPCYIYRKLMECVEGNTELIEMCKLLINQAQNAFQQRLEEMPDDWYALRGLGDIYETLGKTELVKKYPWEPHSEFRWEQTAWVGRQLPNFSATTVDGTPLSFSDYRGKLVLLNFCAKWCGFCAPEIPYIKEVYKERHDKGFDVIGVSLDESETELREYIKEHEIPWVQIFDGKGWKSKLAQYFGINSVPSQWLIDRDGKIISVETRQERLGQLVNWTEISRIGNVIPDFSAEDIKGNLISSCACKDKVVLLFFGNSEQVLTQVDTIYRKYHSKGFEVFGFGPYEALANQFGIDPWRPLPAIVLIDKEGKVIHSRYGQVHSPEAWAAKLEELVATHLGL